MKIDPTYQIILTSKSWPLALPMVNEQGVPIGLAHYESYRDAASTRKIYYVFEGKRFRLVKKVVNNEALDSG